MRTTGNDVQAGALAVHDHVSWSFDDPSSFVAAATSFLAEGARLGERVGYIGDSAVVGELVRLLDLDRIDAGAGR